MGNFIEHLRRGLHKNGFFDFEPDYLYHIANYYSDHIMSTILTSFESINFNVIFSSFDRVDFNNALWGETYAKVFTYFIPRSIWADKPETITLQATQLLTPMTDNLSLVTTIIGEMHYNFWYFGLLFVMPLLQVTKILLEFVLPNNIKQNQ